MGKGLTGSVRWAAILLLVLPGSVNEFLSSATPLSALVFDPIVLPFILGFYGAGVLAIRELAVRWGKGWPSLLLMGAGFSIALEGLAARTFFAANNPSVGFFSTYGRLDGINWIWALMVVLIESLYAVALPILVVDRLLPESSGRSLIPTSALGLCLVSFSAFPIAISLLVTPRPDPVDLGLTALVAGGLWALAYVVPREVDRLVGQGEARSPRLLLVAGTLFSASLVLVNAVLVHEAPPWVTIAVLVALFAVVLIFAGRTIHGGFARRASVAWSAGLLAYFFVGDVTRGVSGEPDLLFVLAAFIALLWLTWSVASRCESGNH